MSRKVSKTAIGAFVLGAIILLVAGILILGGSRFFTKEHFYVTYFDGSVKGLNIGSPVMFRGVKIGDVKDISLVYDPATESVKIPVIFTIEPAKFKGTSPEFQKKAVTIEKAVQIGLRTQLQSQSFVTGQLLVSLDFYPEKPAQFIGLNKQYPEIPSIPTQFEELQKTIENLPLKEIVENVNHALAGIDTLVKNFNEKQTPQTVDATLEDTRALVRNLNSRIGPLADSLQRVARSADATLIEAKKTLVTLRPDLKGVLDQMQTTLAAAQATLKNADQTLETYAKDSPMDNQMNRTLRDISQTARSLRRLSDLLEKHPEVLLKGKAAK